MTPLIGKPAPLFTAESTIGPVSLDQCQGRAVVLYFYPKDNTPGCTTESQDFRDLYEDFLAASTIVLGYRATRSNRTRISRPSTSCPSR